MRRLEADVARDDKRLTLGMFGAEMSHEIAYPLNFLRYLLREANERRARRRARSGGGARGDRPPRAHVRDAAQAESPRAAARPVLVLPRVRRALDLVREIVEANSIAAAIEIPPDLVVVAEPDRLVQILANLLRNAVQAVPSGSAVGVRSRNGEKGGAMVLEVWDEGPGIAEDIGADIFNPFVSSKKGSMGLGLAVTQRLVRGFGWSIGVRREKGGRFSASRFPRRASDRGYTEAVS